MAWDEWEQLKALAAERHATKMQLNQLPADAGGSFTAQPGTSSGGYHVSASSLDGSSHLLIEIAGVLYEGRMDGENATMCRSPRAHEDVSTNVTNFARFAQDQYNDMVVLLAALAGNVESAGNTYTKYDQRVKGQLHSVLVCGSYVDPKDR
ncbi:hypothetical protein AB0F77_01270 [Streptomyces sp. NPDC026672]|uniref:hypothetical protein n=1 Tax=unclassified Streptomyces TaxID=2593676 RepID=UPI0033FAE6E0